MNSNFQLAKENFDKGIINFNNELYLKYYIRIDI